MEGAKPPKRKSSAKRHFCAPVCSGKMGTICGGVVPRIPGSQRWVVVFSMTGGLNATKLRLAKCPSTLLEELALVHWLSRFVVEVRRVDEGKL